VIVATREGPGERVRVVTETEPSIDQYGVLQPFEGWDFLSPVPLPMETVRVEIARDGTVTAVDGEGERSTVGFIEGWRLPGRQDRGRDIVAVVHGDPVFRKGATIPFDPAKAK
jgi:hypothetical protein